MLLFLFFKQKTAYEMRISDWSSDVCSSDREHVHLRPVQCGRRGIEIARDNQTFEDQRRSALNVLIFGQKRRDVRANRHSADVPVSLQPRLIICDMFGANNL